MSPVADFGQLEGSNITMPVAARGSPSIVNTSTASVTTCLTRRTGAGRRRVGARQAPPASGTIEATSAWLGSRTAATARLHSRPADTRLRDICVPNRSGQSACRVHARRGQCTPRIHVSHPVGTLSAPSPVLSLIPPQTPVGETAVEPAAESSDRVRLMQKFLVRGTHAWANHANRQTGCYLPFV